MSDDSIEVVSASGPARQARTMLSETLGSLQLSASDISGVTSAVEATAAAANELYLAETNPGLASFSHIREAIEHLSSALYNLRHAISVDPVSRSASETLSRVLALLYPVVRSQHRARKHVVFHQARAMNEPSNTLVDELPRALPPAPPSGRPRIPTPAYRGSDLRGGDRIEVEVDIGLCSDSHFYTGLSQDISRGGLFIATYQPKAPGTRVALYFALPDGYIVHAQGIVRWARPARDENPPGMGVAFEYLSPADLAAIERFCGSRAPLYHRSGDA